LPSICFAQDASSHFAGRGLAGHKKKEKDGQLAISFSNVFFHSFCPSHLYTSLSISFPLLQTMTSPLPPSSDIRLQQTSDILQLIAIPEIACEVLQYLWPSQLLTLRLVNKAFEELCAPLVTIPILPRHLVEHLNIVKALVSTSSITIADELSCKTSRPLPLLNYTSWFTQATDKIDTLVMASPNLRTLTIPSTDDDDDGDDDTERLEDFYDWLRRHKDMTSFPHIRSFVYNANTDSLSTTVDILESSLPSRTPNLESIRITDLCHDYNGNFDLQILTQVLGTGYWPRLKTISLQVEHISFEGFHSAESRSKVFPQVESLEVREEAEMLGHYARYLTSSWTLLDMFPNLRHLSIDLSCIPGYDSYGWGRERERRQPSVRFPHLASVDAHIDSSQYRYAFYSLLGLPYPFTVPTTIQDHPRTPLPSPPLKKLSLDIPTDDGARIYEAIGDALTYLGISLQGLRFPSYSLLHWNVIHTLSLLQKPCCNNLKALTMDGFNNHCNDLFHLLLAPSPAPPVATPIASSSLTPTTAAASTIIATAVTSTQEQHWQQQVCSSTRTMMSTLGWSRSLTQLYLRPIATSKDQDQLSIPKLNKVLRGLPNLVQFTLEKHLLKDLDLFLGMGRIPVSRLEKELDGDYLLSRPAEHMEAGRGHGVGVGGESGKHNLQKQEQFIVRRPLLEYLRVRFVSYVLLADGARVRLCERFPHLGTLICD
jgi:hypothetical protein